MASTITRRPLPALISLVALLALTAVVWFRVLHRDTGGTTASPAHRTSCAPAPAVATRTLLAPSSITLAVLNSTNRAGIAAKARTTLIADGFQVPHQAANDSASVTSTAQIRFGSAGTAAATLVRFYFPGSTLLRLRTHSQAVTVSLGDKYTSVASAGTVRAALASHRLAVSAAPTAPTPTTSAPTTAAGGSGSAPASPAC